MAVFLTQNSPGLRTSPVKRGYWVVRRVIGEHIPPPQPDVPDLPEDESKLGELTLAETLVKHREHESCSGCHKRFDSLGLVFENYGPVGKWRTHDLGDRRVDASALFPDGSVHEGFAGLRQYLAEEREAEYLENLSRKLFAYALGRTLIPSDDPTVAEMVEKLSMNGYRFSSLIESIVTSRQFLNKRGRRRNSPAGS